MSEPAGSVLIVDDEVNARAVTRDLLLSEGYTLLEAAGVAEALQWIDVARPDVIVSDLMMPGIDGIGLCEALRRRADTRATPIIMVTAADGRDAMLRALQAGATDFLSKPVAGVELRARVRSMMHISNEHRLLQELLQLRSDLTHMAMHDMRSPLQAMMFSVEVLRRRVTEAAPVAAIENIRGNIARLQKFIDDVLIIARRESGLLTLARQSVAIAELVGGVIDDLQTVAEHSKIRIQLHCSSPAILSADVSLLRRCVENLLTNALKFSPPDSVVEVNVDASPELVTMEVCDEGPGIAVNQLESVFEPFRIGDVHAGTSQIGLGLAFCRMVVNAHSGAIVARRREPRGTIVSVTLPRHDPEMAA